MKQQAYSPYMNVNFLSAYLRSFNLSFSTSASVIAASKIRFLLLSAASMKRYDR